MSELNTESKILPREEIAAWAKSKRDSKAKIVFTNGCFDILHQGHVTILEEAKSNGDFLIVGLNSDASVRRLKGDSRPINDQAARARVLAGLQAVDAVCVFEEDTPIPLLEDVQPDVHVKGGDYVADELPEAETVKKHGGQIVIVPLVQGFSTTSTLEKMQSKAVVVIPARYGSTRFPGKPLAKLAGQTVISRVVRAALKTSAARPVLVATDDARIAAEIESQFPKEEATAVMTSESCQTGTDRIAEVLRARFASQVGGRLIVLNIQGDEPFVDAAHLDQLIAVMQRESTLRMATLATPLAKENLEDTNVVKVVTATNGDALYFSRLPIPLARDAKEQSETRRWHHLGVYAYEAKWLLEMANLPPAPLEQTENLEQLRALENGVAIRVVQVEDVVPIAIDTPRDLEEAENFLRSRTHC